MSDEWTESEAKRLQAVVDRQHALIAGLKSASNRWAAFTDDELDHVNSALDHAWQDYERHPAAERVGREITAEIERRKA